MHTGQIELLHSVLDSSKYPASSIGENKRGGFEMLFQVRRLGERGERRPLAARRRKKQDVGIAALRVGDEYRAQARALNRLGENEVAGGEVDLDVFFVEV